MKTTHVSWSKQFQPTNYKEPKIKFVIFLSNVQYCTPMKLKSINPGLSLKI